MREGERGKKRGGRREGGREGGDELQEQQQLIDNLTARRAGQPRVLKAIGAMALQLVGEAVALGLRSRNPAARDPRAQLIATVTQSLSGPTWNRYGQVFKPWTAFARDRGAAFLPIDPALFAHFLAEVGTGKAGYVGGFPFFA